MTHPLGKLLENHIAALKPLEEGAVVTKSDDYYGGKLADLSDRYWQAVDQYCRSKGAFPDLAKNQFGWHLRLTRMR